MINYSSKKHSLYRCKCEVLVLPNGFAMGPDRIYRGGTHDIEIIRSNMELHKFSINKSEHERQKLNDTGRELDRFENYWAVFVDRGY